MEGDAQKKDGGTGARTGGSTNSARNRLAPPTPVLEPGRKHTAFFFRGKPASRCWKRKVELRSSDLGGWLVSLT